MTQNGTVNKTDTFNVSATRRDFLAALYKGSPEELYLELRCIHPVTGEVKPLWSTIDDKRNLGSIFRQAEKLNQEGFSLYFAPCLRSTKRGKSESAALVTALWADLDCDNDPRKRKAALEKLREFSIPPSILIDSGGGFHPYWLLEAPFDLTEEEHKQHFADLLRGLSKAVGGDLQYVKSTASVIRLPGSINTKPGRGGEVAILELYPEQRYALSAFEWLKVEETKSQASYPMSTSTAGDYHHRLPERTQQYLTHGAHNGNRNSELFAAACQLRDASCTQSEAERVLIPRHVADGTTGENPLAREQEAQATIASAYANAAREPLPPARETEAQVTQNLVDMLVREFGHKETEKRPSAEQIREAVIACAQLDPLLWAEKRKQLKQICGDAFKAEDLNRMYREAQKSARKAAFTEGVMDAARYFESDGHIIYEYPTERGMKKQTVALWTGRIKEELQQVNDDGQQEQVSVLELQDNVQKITLNVPADVFGDDAALRRFIAGKAGVRFTVRAGMGKHLVPALNELSGAYHIRQTYRLMGWVQINGELVYVSPTGSVNTQGWVESPPDVELETRLREYGLKSCGWQECLTAFRSTIAVLPPTLAPALIAFALLPIVQRFFPSTTPKPALHLVGTSGSGKSEIAALLTGFYGQFSRDTPPAQWGDTINMVEALGYPLVDALYWVDDYKNIYADERAFTRFLQSYSREMGRGRMTREAKLRHDRPCRGLILSTGETTIEGEASVLARMMVLQVPPWEQRDPGGKALKEAEQMRHVLPGFTAHFAAWIAKQGETLEKYLAEEFALSQQGYQNKLRATKGKLANTDRIIKNWSVLVTVYRLLIRFLRAHDCEEILPSWQDVIVETVSAMREERAGEVFLDMLGQLLAGGQVIIDDDMRHPRDPAPGTVVIGYRDGHEVYLLPDVALREINRVHPLRFNATAIGMQLKEDGILIPGNTNLTVQKRVRGSITRFWRLKSEILGCDGCDTCDGDT